MKKIFLPYLVVVMSLLGQCVLSQSEKDTKELGLPGDNLDLYAVLTLFQKSKTVEEFEKSLNEQKTGINNLDLNLDKKVDFITVSTKKEGETFTFILNTAVSKTETQDIAVIMVDKDKGGKVSLQIVGDQELYGKNYVIEPAKTATPAVTANPAYTGPEPAVSAPATTTVIVETVPIVQYVYSPVYVPYYPPYHYGFYPPYFTAFAVIAIGVYRHNNYYHHSGYYGGHYHHGGNTVVIHNTNVYNNYNKTKMKSATVHHNTTSGRYNTINSNHNKAHNPSAATTNKSKSSSGATRQPAASPTANRTKKPTTTRQPGQNASRAKSAGARRR
jgi:hypothetical protein